MEADFFLKKLSFDKNIHGHKLKFDSDVVPIET